VSRLPWLFAGAAVLAAVAACSEAEEAPPAPAGKTPPNTGRVERGPLAASVSSTGTLTFRARPDGSPYTVVNQATGIYTKLPGNGDRPGCGDVLYRVDDEPVLLLCGRLPAYRDLHEGDRGRDVRQLNRNLRRLGLGADPGDDEFTAKTANALEALQHRRGREATGALDLGDAIFLPGPVRIARVTARPGAPARPGAQVAQATSATVEVRVDLAASRQGVVRRGDRARITLPSNTAVAGKVVRLGRVVQAPEDESATTGTATLPVSIRLDDPAKARGFDAAPVRVEITTGGVEDALSVPVTALVGYSGGGFAVEAVRAGGRRELVAVQLGLFDAAGARVQIAGDVREGDHVVVPSP
jgi:hypothetical protein